MVPDLFVKARRRRNLTFGAWPLLAGRSATDPWPVRPAVSVTGGAVLLGLVGWFFGELAADTGRVGVSERVAAAAQSLWPLAVAWASWGSRRWRR